MSDRRDFLEAIAAAPDDDLPRLVFADWLEEGGEGRRAEFIRVQCEANRLPAGSLEQLAARRRAGDLFDPAWLPRGWRRAPAAQWGWDYEARDLGLLDAAEDGCADLISTARLTLTPLAFATEAEAAAWATRLAADPMMRAVVAIDADGAGPFTGAGFAALIASPHLVNLRSLRVGCPADLSGVRALCAAPLRLRCLELGRSLGGPEFDPDEVAEAVRLLASAPSLAALEVLRLYDNGLGAADVAALIVSPTLRPGLRIVWEEQRGDYPDELYDALARRFDLG